MRRVLTPFKPKSTKLEAAELLHTLAETRGEGLPHHAHICVTSCRPERHQQTACFGPWTAQPPFARRSGAGRAVPLPHLNNGAMGQVCAAGGCGQALTDTVRTQSPASLLLSCNLEFLERNCLLDERQLESAAARRTAACRSSLPLKVPSTSPDHHILPEIHAHACRPLSPSAPSAATRA